MAFTGSEASRGERQARILAFDLRKKVPPLASHHERRIIAVLGRADTVKLWYLVDLLSEEG